MVSSMQSPAGRSLLEPAEKRRLGGRLRTPRLDRVSSLSLALQCLAFLLLLHQATPTLSASAGSVYDNATRSGVVRIGAPYHAAPWGFFDADGKLTGFEAELAEELARRLNLKPEIEKVDDNSWPGLLASGRLDAVLCRIRHTRSLDRRFDFTVAYFFDRQAILIQKGTFKEASELSGRKVAALKASVYERQAMKTLRDAGDKQAERNVISCPDRPTCFLAFGKEKAAGWLDSAVNLLEYSSKSPGKFELLMAGTAVEEIAVALPQDDSAWRDALNFAIQDTAVDGTLKKLHDKWFGPDTPYSFPAWRAVDVWPE
jgi:polar amino acid transport system substrate-binding protein